MPKGGYGKGGRLARGNLRECRFPENGMGEKSPDGGFRVRPDGDKGDVRPEKPDMEGLAAPRCGFVPELSPILTHSVSSSSYLSKCSPVGIILLD